MEIRTLLKCTVPNLFRKLEFGNASGSLTELQAICNIYERPIELFNSTMVHIKTFGGTTYSGKEPFRL